MKIRTDIKILPSCTFFFYKCLKCIKKNTKIKKSNHNTKTVGGKETRGVSGVLIPFGVFFFFFSNECYRIIFNFSMTSRDILR